MRLVVDATAWDDLNQIGAWIAKDNLRAARAMLERILQTIEQLQSFPRLARQGRAHDTYEARPTLSSSSSGKTRRQS